MMGVHFDNFLPVDLAMAFLELVAPNMIRLSLGVTVGHVHRLSPELSAKIPVPAAVVAVVVVEGPTDHSVLRRGPLLVDRVAFQQQTKQTGSELAGGLWDLGEAMAERACLSLCSMRAILWRCVSRPQYRHRLRRRGGFVAESCSVMWWW